MNLEVQNNLEIQAITWAIKQVVGLMMNNALVLKHDRRTVVDTRNSKINAELIDVYCRTIEWSKPIFCFTYNTLE